MGVIAPPLPVEVDRGIARVLGRVALGAASTHRKLFRLAQASNCVPSTVQCSSESSPAARAWAWTASKNAAATSPDSSRSILGKRRGMPDRVIHIQPDEPPEQQVVVELFHSSRSLRTV